MKNRTKGRIIVASGFILAVAAMTGCATNPLALPPIAPDFDYHPHGAITTDRARYGAVIAPVEDKVASALPMMNNGAVAVQTLHQDWLTLWQPENFSRIMAQDLAASGLFKSVAAQQQPGGDNDTDIVIKPAFVHAYSSNGKATALAFGGWMSLEAFRGKRLLFKKIYRRTESPVVWKFWSPSAGYSYKFEQFMNPFSAKGSYLEGRMSTDQYMNDFTSGLMDEIRKDLAGALGVSGAAKTTAPETDDNMVH